MFNNKKRNVTHNRKSLFLKVLHKLYCYFWNWIHRQIDKDCCVKVGADVCVFVCVCMSCFGTGCAVLCECVSVSGQYGPHSQAGKCSLLI